MRSTGRCHSRSTTCGPHRVSNSLPSRGPTPFNAVTGAKSGLSEAGRKLAAPGALDLELQEAPGVAVQELVLVGRVQRQLVERPFGAGRVEHEGVIDREQDAVEPDFLDAIIERVVGKESAGGDIEVPQEFVAEAFGMLAVARQRHVDAPQEKGESFTKVPEDDLDLGIG